MKKNILLFGYLILSVLIFSCKKLATPSFDNPDVISQSIDTTLKSFYPQMAPSPAFEGIYNYDFSAHLPSSSILIINLYWYAPSNTHGIYLHFNNNDGDVLIDNNGFIQSFDSGIKIDSTISGSWSENEDGIFAFDYVNNPSAHKGNLAGKSDKYIVFRATDHSNPLLFYYGWLRVTVSENGRNLIVHSIGFQKNANESLKTGEV